MKTKAVLIGCGRIAPMHLSSIKMIKNCELLAVCDIKEERAKETAIRYGCKYYNDYKNMIITEKPNVVHICSPHYLHHEMAVFAAEQGANVVLEKPMSITYEDAEDIVNTCKNNKVLLSIMFQNRYNRAVKYIKKEIENGNLGKVLAAKIIVTWNRSEEYYLKSDWKGTWEKEGGGVVIDQAIHSLDLVRYIIDKEPTIVQADIFNRRHKKIEVEDCAEGIVEFEDNIVLSFYTMNYFTKDSPIEISIHCEKGTANIIGDEGYVEYVDGRITNIKLKENDKIDYGNGFKRYWGYCHYLEIRDIYDAIINNREVAVSGEDCLKTQKIVNSIYDSSKNKCSIKL